MRFGAALLALASAMLGTAVLAQPGGPTPTTTTTQQVDGYVERVTALASGMCVDLLSGRVAPPTLTKQERFWSGYGLQPGMPQAAITALTPYGLDVVDQAILAHGPARDGNFGVALGGRDGHTCRIFVYNMPKGADVTSAVMAALTAPGAGWRELSPPRAIPGVTRRSVSRRIGTYAVLLNSTTPIDHGPIAAVFYVAIIPANVTLSEGF